MHGSFANQTPRRQRLRLCILGGSWRLAWCCSNVRSVAWTAGGGLRLVKLLFPHLRVLPQAAWQWLYTGSERTVIEAGGAWTQTGTSCPRYSVARGRGPVRTKPISQTPARVRLVIVDLG